MSMGIDKNNNSFDMEDAIKKLSSVSEEQFEIIKHEKWYIRLWETVTFSRKGEMKLSEQVSTLAQAQQIIAQYLLKKSLDEKEISDIVRNNASYIKKLAGNTVCFKEKLTSLSNLVLLLNEINNGYYSSVKPITAICMIIAQLDNVILSDPRALNNICMSMNNHDVLNGKNIDVIDFLIDVSDMDEKEIPLVYTELSTIEDNEYAKLVLLLIHKIYFAKDENLDREDIVLDVALQYGIEKKYDTTNLNHVFESLINSVISHKVAEGDFSITNPTAKQEREEAEKLFYAGRLIEAYPKFIHSADIGDARACYFAARYYRSAYGTTEKNDELYLKYVNLGIQRRDSLCCLEYSLHMYNQGSKTKAESWRNKALPQVGKMADRGDLIASQLLSNIFFHFYIMDSIEKDKNIELNEREQRMLSASCGVYKNYTSKALEGGYWLAAFNKCFSPECMVDGDGREKNIEKYGWMFENVEWSTIQIMMGSRYLILDQKEKRYYKNAIECFLKAYKLQKTDYLCGMISFFLNADLIGESEEYEISKKDIKPFYYKGLDSDEPSGLEELGDLYYTGVGDKHAGVDREAAFEHYERAYEGYTNNASVVKYLFNYGRASTAYKLGYMLVNGIGTECNNERAISYYEDAIQYGDERAIKALAECYSKGIGVKRNLERSNELLSMIKND
ncbi:tetratricopeptide repeat protein [Butyrivibrio sp. NC2002]|uniref:tetratricopeptide repeat protein n=1 Tax=Butyrivibrio sp. NC2002 TaxID=1410610 RepID=UPI000563BE6F|nr:tetratricopeptide repeat protein [Butyrivibrio sp. NC2002]